MSRWNFLGRMDKGGHRFFEDNVSKRIAVADESGDSQYGRMGTPDCTDDGVIWLDLSKPIQINKKSIETNSLLLPCKMAREGNRSVVVGESLVGGIKAGRKFGYEFDVDQQAKELLWELYQFVYTGGIA